MKELQIGIIGILYGVEPLLWLYVMSSASQIRKKKAFHFAAVLGYYVLSVSKQYCTFGTMGEVKTAALSFFVQIYIIFATMFLFEQASWKKIIMLAIFFGCNMSTELICGEVFLLITQKSVDEVLQFGISNIVCTFLAKMLLALFCYFLVNKSKEDYFDSLYNIRLFPFVVSAVLVEMPFPVIFCFAKKVLRSKFMLVFFLFAQSYLIVMTVYVLHFLITYYKDMEKLKGELQKNKSSRELKRSVLKLQHDMSFSISMIQYFLKKRQYTELEEFVQGIAEELGEAEDIFILPNQTVANTLNLMAKQARKKQVKFEHIITFLSDTIPSRDLSILLFNILQNAIEAAIEVDTDRRKVLLEMGRRQGGCYINCLNTYQDRQEIVQELFSTSKKNKLLHGKGLSIIKRIMENNGGIMKIHFYDTLFEIDCFIPDKEGDN